MRKNSGRERTWQFAAASISMLALMTCATEVLARENYALIVTASDYPNLDQKYWLKGPKNDAALVRDYLTTSAPVRFSPEHVVTLGSGEGMVLASHQAIVDNLRTLASEAKPGDFVYLQFSGHGSQQPALADKSEPDGKDEVFLSADTMMAPPDNPTFYPNVLTDDEMAAALKAIRKTGAFVWVVFDSCHSGTMTRGAPDDADTTFREISPAALGIADSAFTAAATGGETMRAAPLAADVYEDEATDGAEGGLVAFFAAQTTEQAPETEFDVMQPDGSTAKVNYGVFTHAIFSSLAKNPNMTYRQLAQSVLASYVADNWLKPTPLFEGKLDAQVFGSDDAVPTAQWPIVAGSDGSLSISAGQLQGLAAGTTLLIVPSPAAANEDAIGEMAVASVSQLRAKVAPAPNKMGETIDAKAIPPGAYLRLVEVQYPFELTVARPDTAGANAAQVSAVNAALDAIAADPDKPLKLKLVPAGESADLRLAILSDQSVARLANPNAPQPTTSAAPKLWLLPASGEASLDPGRRAPALLLPAAGAAAAEGSDFKTKLGDSLTTVFRATGLSRLTAASTFGPRDFKLSFGRQDAGSDAIAEMPAEATPIIRAGDRLYVDFTNGSGKAADLNLLYVDHDYGITLLCNAHLAAGDRLFQPFADIQESDIGSERIVAVINESGKEITDLRFLTQPGLAATRGGEQPGLLGMLDDLGAGLATRAAPVSQRDTKTPRGAVVLVPLEALPATGATAAADTPVNDPRTPEGECSV